MLLLQRGSSFACRYLRSLHFPDKKNKLNNAATWLLIYTAVCEYLWLNVCPSAPRQKQIFTNFGKKYYLCGGITFYFTVNFLLISSFYCRRQKLLYCVKVKTKPWCKEKHAFIFLPACLHPELKTHTAMLTDRQPDKIKIVWKSPVYIK